MEKKIAALLGAVAGLATMASAQASSGPGDSSEALQASSYADLLAPVPNAVEQLKADNAARAKEAAAENMAGVQTAQYYPYYYYRHHHHHHHRYWMRSYHHHHHHHNSGFWRY